MIIADQVRRGHNVLITCPSHAAVDSLLEKLASLSLFKINDILRLGHLAKVKKELHKYCLDYKVFGKTKRLIKKKKQRKAHEAEFLREAKVVLGTCTTPAPEGKLDFYNEVIYILTLTRSLRRKLRISWFFDVFKVKESSFFKALSFFSWFLYPDLF